MEMQPNLWLKTKILKIKVGSVLAGFLLAWQPANQVKLKHQQNPAELLIDIFENTLLCCKAMQALHLYQGVCLLNNQWLPFMLQFVKLWGSKIIL